jgi:formylglycine-generating enzyme required for sulfatase activity
VVLAALVVQVAFAGGSDGNLRATASAVSAKAFKKYKKTTNRKIRALQEQLETLQRQPGPQGVQGPAGTAPACQGNGSGDEMVAAGDVCIDRYEVSVWSTPTGGTQYGTASDNYPCDDDGQDCTNIYARSVAGVTPSRFITYFQAQQAVANVGKRLPTNAEWQQAVAGTPDSTACNGGTGVVASTGANGGCVSRFGAFDMVGNLDEWVGDWVPASTGCPGWGPVGTFSSNDAMCLSGASTTDTGPGALIRGGDFRFGLGDTTDAGPFAVEATRRPSESVDDIGFRGAR